MDWPYHFVDLSNEQKHQRRQLLDHYGSLAQVSVLGPLLILQCYFVVVSLSGRWRNQAGLDVPSSPRAKEKRSHGKVNTHTWTVTLRKLRWWCSGPCTILATRLGSRGDVVAAIVWTGWLLLLCFLQTDDDYLHLTKRFGAIAASQLPFHYLIALKSPFSPLQLLTRCSHATLNNFHQLLGRTVTLLLYLHAAFYLSFYILSNLLSSKLQEAYVLCGVFGIIAFIAVSTTALAPVRKWSYRVFYITHVTLATAILPVLFFHVSHIRLYLYETAIVYALNLVFRTLSSKTLSGTLRLIPGTNLLEIDIPLTTGRATLQRWHAGQHAYVSLAGHALLRTLRSNPFTVTSIPNTDGKLRFIARILDGNTAKLAQVVSAAKTNQSVTVEGPYGVATHPERLTQYDRVLFVAGGVGATFIVPLYRQLLADLSPSKGSYRRQKTHFVWAVRSKTEMLWALPKDTKEREGFVERLKVCVTGISEDAASAAEGSLVLTSDHDGDAEDGIELEEQKNLLSGTDVSAQTSDDGIPTFAGRPNLPNMVDQVFTHGDSAERVAIIVCGPPSLSQALRREVSKWVARGRDVWFWDEIFAL